MNGYEGIRSIIAIASDAMSNMCDNFPYVSSWVHAPPPLTGLDRAVGALSSPLHGSVRLSRPSIFFFRV